jgi:RNA polymerase sigma-70 factor (ECF subfamily)
VGGWYVWGVILLEMGGLLSNRQQNTPDAELEADPRKGMPFEEIVRRYQRDVRLFVVRHLGYGPAGDDVAQEVFIEVYRCLPTFQGSGSLRGWILGIARHRVGTWLRNEVRNRRVAAADLESDLIQYRMARFEAEADSDSTDQDDDLIALRNCLAQLESEHRQLIDSFYFQHKTAESIAADEGKNAGSVRMALLRIRNGLGKCIRQLRRGEKS